MQELDDRGLYCIPVMRDWLLFLVCMGCLLQQQHCSSFAVLLLVGWLSSCCAGKSCRQWQHLIYVMRATASFEDARLNATASYVCVHLHFRIAGGVLLL